ncbi:MAG: hypothetical protein SFX74_07985 [Fimbriimonadaceae bacterium]|nr:hypothetical protein [Fimbriimonadaceae bacterium]
MQFYVFADDGKKYGPADFATIQQWAMEGRILPSTLLENVDTTERRVAGSIPGINFPSAGGPEMEPPRAGPMYAGPTVGGPANNGLGAPNVPIGSYANPPRYGSLASDSQPLVTRAWIYGVLGLCCCFVFSIVGIMKANRALKMGNRAAQAPLVFNIVMLVINVGWMGAAPLFFGSMFSGL